MADWTSDPYNWKTPSRKDLMSLQTINQIDTGSRNFKPKEARNTNLNTLDIRGASPQLRPYQFCNKETYVNRLDDIDGTKSKQLIKTTFNTALWGNGDRSLKTDDLKGAQPRVNQFQTTRTPLNPLQPEYKISHVEKIDTTPPKFVRDQININDIEGAQPKSKVFKPRKDPYSYDEIEGTHSKKRFQPKDIRNNLNVEDINGFNLWRSQRQVNPLIPIYKVQDDKGQSIQYGTIEGSSSKRLHPVTSNKIDGTLDTNNIEGAKADTHTQYFLRRGERKDFRPINNTKDIDGAQVNTLKKGLISVRTTNPLQPEYQLPGAREEIEEREAEQQGKQAQNTTSAGLKKEEISRNSVTSNTQKRENNQNVNYSLVNQIGQQPRSTTSNNISRINSNSVKNLPTIEKTNFLASDFGSKQNTTANKYLSTAQKLDQFVNK